MSAFGRIMAARRGGAAPRAGAHPLLLVPLALTTLCGCAGERLVATEPDVAAAPPAPAPAAEPAGIAHEEWFEVVDAYLDVPGAEASRLASGEASGQGPGLGARDAADAGGPPDLWARARARFRLAHERRPRTVREIEWFRRNQEYLDRVAERARLYLHHIVSEVERRDLPGELALLPIVESAYHPFAYSPAHASGIWQFIPSTGRLYGLRRSWWYDGRRDVVESTRAALDYLENLHAEFDGDWLLALAAYNSGEGNVRKALRRNRHAGKKLDFWSLRLPRETRAYVPRLLAVASIVDDPAAHGLVLNPIADEPYFSVAELDGQIDLALAAELAGVSLDELYRLNPGFSRWATDPKGPHRLLLPIDAVPAFEQRLAEVPADERIQWHRHVIHRGDTLGGIARRYRTSVSALKEANGLRGNLIRAGHSLMVPVASRSLADYRLSAHMRRAMRRGVPGTGQKVSYRVRRGDNLWAISRRYRVSVSKLASWNGIARTSVLRPGQRLVIWRHSPPAASSRPVAARGGVYVVRPGDNLWLIARRNGLSVENLAEWNQLAPGQILMPGQKLLLEPAPGPSAPASGDDVSASAGPAPGPAATPSRRTL